MGLPGVSLRHHLSYTVAAVSSFQNMNIISFSCSQFFSSSPLLAENNGVKFYSRVKF